MTLRAVCGALAQRELQPASLGVGLLSSIVAGAACGMLAGRFPDAHSGAIMLILQFDSTLAGVLSIVAVFRVITRLSADGASDWLQQLVAAGVPRSTYVAALLLGIPGALLLCYLAGVWAFAGVEAVSGGGYDPALRGIVALPLVALLLFAATAFGSATCCLVGAHAARGVAVTLLGLPWVLAWIGAVSGAEVVPPWLARAVTIPAPPLAVSPAIRPTAQLLIYAGISLALTLVSADRRVARL